MKKIKCPYDWDCGKEFNSDELNEFDLEFLESGVKNKMEMMFIHCPSCARKFMFNAVEWVSKDSHAKQPTKKNVGNKTTLTKELTSVLKKNKIELPKSYLKYLIGKDFKSTITIFEDEDDFKLYNLKELCNEITIDGQKLLQVNELKGFSNSIMEVSDDFFNKKEKEEYQELASCLSIGYENSRVLYIDNKDNNTLHIFHPEGGDTEKVKQVSLKDVIKASR